MRLTELFLKNDPPDQREIERMRRYIQERIKIAANAVFAGQDRPHDRDFGDCGGHGLRGEPGPAFAP